MCFVTCAQMKMLEQQADAAGLSYYQMMENAGTAASDYIISKATTPISDSNVLIFCGKGNNGGDGFVVARKLSELGATVTIAMVDGPPVTTDAVTNYNLIKDSMPVTDMSTTGLTLYAKPDIIIDAVYGTGFHGELNERALSVSRFARNHFDIAQIFALDIPSGLSGDATLQNENDKRAVHAHHTITFHSKKPIHLQAFAKEFCGEIFVADIGISEI